MIVAETIEAYHKEPRCKPINNNLVWRPLQDNDQYEVSADGGIRHVGNKYALASRKGRVRIFKDGVPVFVMALDERVKVFTKKTTKSKLGHRFLTRFV